VPFGRNGIESWEREKKFWEKVEKRWLKWRFYCMQLQFSLWLMLAHMWCENFIKDSKSTLLDVFLLYNVIQYAILYMYAAVI